MSVLSKNLSYFKNTDLTTDNIEREADTGLELLQNTTEPIVTIFGSHKTTRDDPMYKHAYRLAYDLGKKGYAVATGGGPGIMEAANKGAKEAGAPSIGLQAGLIKGEDVDGTNFTHLLAFDFVFIRRFILSIKSISLVFYPGGYGTLNELFEYAVLMQVNIADRVPMICVNQAYWQGLFAWLNKKLAEGDKLIDKEKDMNLLKFVDERDRVVELIERRQEWPDACVDERCSMKGA